jgi:hypothetical protein
LPGFCSSASTEKPLYSMRNTIKMLDGNRVDVNG